MPEYTVGAVAAVVLVVLLERFRWRTGIFGRRTYWIAMAICLFFMVLVNGWLTKLSAPIVEYDPAMKTPWRFPWDIPVEDYLFGFALLTAVIARWEVRGRSDDVVAPRPDQVADATVSSPPCPQSSPSSSRSSPSS